MEPEEHRDNAKADTAEAALQEPMRVLTDALEGKKHLLGKEFTVADLNLAQLISWGRGTNFDFSDIPKSRGGWIILFRAPPI